MTDSVRDHAVLTADGSFKVSEEELLHCIVHIAPDGLPGASDRAAPVPGARVREVVSNSRRLERRRVAFDAAPAS